MAIKNIDLLAGKISSDEIERIESAAEFHINHSHVFFEIISVKHNEVQIRAEQMWNIAENYANEGTLKAWSIGILENSLPGYAFIIYTVPFVEFNFDCISYNWIIQEMESKKRTITELSLVTGIPPSKFNKWLIDEGEMTRAAYSIFYYALNKLNRPRINVNDIHSITYH